MKSFKLFAALLVGLFLTLSATAAEASPAGTWKWSVQNRQGGQGFEQSLTLHFKDGKLTGKLHGMQGGQFQVPDVDITDASFKDGVVKFAVTREFNGNAFTTRYEGKIEGDVIKGAFKRPGFNGGEAVKRDWEAKRQK